MSTEALRTLKIKTGVVKRTLKDLECYKKELSDNKAKVEEIRKSDDHSMLKQWETVVSETQGMIPDTTKRIRTAVDELRELVDGAAGDSTMAKSPEFAEAKKTLQSASEIISK